MAPVSSSRKYPKPCIGIAEPELAPPKAWPEVEGVAAQNIRRIQCEGSPTSAQLEGPPPQPGRVVNACSASIAVTSARIKSAGSTGDVRSAFKTARESKAIVGHTFGRVLCRRLARFSLSRLQHPPRARACRPELEASCPCACGPDAPGPRPWAMPLSRELNHTMFSAALESADRPASPMPQTAAWTS